MKPQNYTYFPIKITIFYDFKNEKKALFNFKNRKNSYIYLVRIFKFLIVKHVLFEGFIAWGRILHFDLKKIQKISYTDTLVLKKPAIHIDISLVYK
jgi:hypothetical protein